MPLLFYSGLKGRLFSGCHGNNRDNLAVFLGSAKLDFAVDGCKNRVILADADAGSGVPGGAALADDDIACHDVFAAEGLDAEPAACGVAAVAG